MVRQVKEKNTESPLFLSAPDDVNKPQRGTDVQEIPTDDLKREVETTFMDDFTADSK